MELCHIQLILKVMATQDLGMVIGLYQTLDGFNEG